MPGHDSSRDAITQLLAGALLAGADGVLARVWRMGPGDLCEECAMRAECADRSRCLHLSASAGTTGRVDGPFRRFPLGAREVGRVPETLEPHIVNDDLGSQGLADRAWLMAHDVRAFAAVPIVDGGECFGVLAVFGRSAIDPGRLRAIEALAAIAARALAAAASAPAPRRVPPAARGRGAPDFDVLRAWHDIEREVLERVLEHTGGRVSGPRGAAALLELKPTTLHSRMKKLGVRRKRA